VLRHPYTCSLNTCGLIAVLVLAVICLVSGSRAVGSAEEPRIVILTSSRAAPYEEALAGFQQALRQQGIRATFDVHSLEEDPRRVTRVLQDVKQGGIALLLTLGTAATQKARQDITAVPIIAGLVLSADEFKGAPNMSGVTLDFPVALQLDWLRRFLPTAKTIGVIYNPKENQQRIEAASRVAHELGLRLESQQVSDTRELPTALETLAKKIDVLWGVVDELVLTPQTAKHVLLFSFQNRIPFVGLSTAWVKAGAVYALDWDYTDLGMQCGEMALKVLRGTSINALPPSAPRKVVYALNQKTARHMKIEIAETLVRGAREVF
jgi:putative tryptophan/tyrosine transport system substrate-binding protein